MSISCSTVSYLQCKLYRIDYLGWGRESFFFLLLSLTCVYAVSVRKGFLFLLVLGVGCIILL